jgi:hypothetical protein
VRALLVLGAGASLAHAEYFHSQRGRDRNPPLDYTFFDKVRALQLGIPGRLREYGRSVPRRDPFVPSPESARLEEFFKDVYYDLVDVPGNLAIRDTYVELVELYARVLRETTNWICERTRTGGPVGRLLAAVGDWADNVSVITFNHDLIIENEIIKRANLRKRWCLEQGYGLFSEELEVTSPAAGTPSFPKHSAACNHDRGIAVIKLHGSLNMYVRIASDTPTAPQLTGRGDASQIFVSRRRTVPPRLRYVKSGGQGRRTYPTWPVVVPPVYAKDSLIKRYLATPWEEARTQLSQADAIFFFGYSMPETDIQAERLFSRALRRNGSATVTIINPGNDSAARFASIVRDHPLIRFPTVDAFLMHAELSLST